MTLARARRGEPGALRVVVETYQGPVLAYLGRMLLVDRDDATVQDLAQETFVRVVRRLAGFDPTGPARLSTWILTVATNLALDELRRRRRRAGSDLTDLAELVAAEADRPDAIANRRQQARALLAAVAALAPDYRAAFLLREAHGMSYDEIARVLRVEIGTVKSRLNRARRALRAALEGTR